MQNQLTVSLPAHVPFTPAYGDIVAAFVGSECRGVGTAGKSFTVFRISADETIQLRYYSTEKTGVYRFLQTVSLDGNENKNLMITF